MTELLDDVITAIRRGRVIGIIRRDSADSAVQHGRKLLEAGLKVIEVSFTTPDAAKAVTALRSQAPPGVVVGAGTVLNPKIAAEAIAAGAQIVVAPNLNPAVMAHALDAGIAAIPGVATVTETMRAVELGASFVKLFPAATLGPEGMAAILEVVPNVAYVPTGGVTIADAPRWFDAGAVALGMGASLAEGTIEEIAARAALLQSRQDLAS